MKIDQPNNDFWFYELHPKRANWTWNSTKPRVLC